MNSNENLNDEYFMKEALAEARRAYSLKETPIGAVVVYKGVIVGRGYNKVETGKDPTLHAEMVAIKEACKNLGRWRLYDCTLYVTLEPCFMCIGAVANSRIKDVVIGTEHRKNHVVSKHNDYKADFCRDNGISLKFGVMEEQCSSILTSFFKERRNKIL